VIVSGQVHGGSGAQGQSATAESIAALVGRIADIFGVLDLSFVVAGAVALGALVFGGYAFRAFDSWADMVPSDARGLHVVGAILGCYVLGIVCFAAGRKLRRDERFYVRLPDHLRSFGLAERYQALIPPAAKPGAPRGGADARRRRAHDVERCALLYTGLWAEVRQSSELSPSYNLLMRYWVMAAMCDGLFAAFCLWEVLFVLYALGGTPREPPSSGVLSALVALGLAGAAALSMIEARRYSGAQMYELCATLASHHAPRAAEAAMTHGAPARGEAQADGAAANGEAGDQP
jgi:hypothetical protein